MTDDLTTLLRDAGREPTIDLDVDAVHARGRRRAMVRRTAAGVGALALAGVLGVGVANLLDAPDVPIVDQAPDDTTEDATEDTTPDDTVVDSGLITAADVARTYGITVHELGFDVDDFDGFDVTVTTPDGAETGRWDEDATQFADPVVADDGGIWAMTPDGRTVRRDPTTGAVVTVARTGSDTGWLPIGRYDDGRGSVLVTEVGLGDTTVAPPSAVYVAPAGGALPFQPFPATEDLGLPSDEGVVAAAAVAEELVVLVGDDAGTRAVLLPSGRPGTELLDVRGLDIALTDVAIAGREVWATGRSDAGEAVLYRVDLDTLEIVAVPTPAGVAAVDRVSAAPDGAALALGVRDGDGQPATVVLDTVRSGSDATDAVVLASEAGVAALVDLLPWREDSDVPLAACATTWPFSLNAPPSGSGSEVWWLCPDATSQLDEDVAYPFVAVQVPPGGDGTMPAEGPRRILEVWAAGPEAAGMGGGLSGGLDFEVAGLADVTLDGSTVVVDLVSGPQIGILSATYASGAFIGGVVGTALQYPEADAVRITLDGSCTAFGDLVQAGGCLEFDRSAAPWSQ